MLLDRALLIKLVMDICNEADGGYYHNCYCWKIQSSYNFRNGANVELVIHQHISGPCSHQPLSEYMTGDLAFLNVVIFVLAVMYLLLLLKSLMASLACYLRVRQAYNLHRRLQTPHVLVQR
jgi:hypothetical protein